MSALPELSALDHKPFFTSQERIQELSKRKNIVLSILTIIYVIWDVFLFWTPAPLLMMISLPNIFFLIMTYYKGKFYFRKEQKDSKFYFWLAMIKSILCTGWSAFIFYYHRNNTPQTGVDIKEWEYVGKLIGIAGCLDLLLLTSGIYIIKKSNQIIKLLEVESLEQEWSSYNSI